MGRLKSSKWGKTITKVNHKYHICEHRKFMTDNYLFRSTALHYQNFYCFYKIKSVSSFRYGYRKCATHIQVFAPNSNGWELEE